MIKRTSKDFYIINLSHGFHKNIRQLFLTLMMINDVSLATISILESCDIEDWKNHAEYSALPS